MGWLLKLLGRNDEPRWHPAELAGVSREQGVVARQGLANGEPAPRPSAEQRAAEQLHHRDR